MMKLSALLTPLFLPCLSFASTASDSLSGIGRDTFDKLSENPAFVNQEGGKTLVRIGKSKGLQIITEAGVFGLGIQVNNDEELEVVRGTFNSKDAPAEFTGASTSALAAAAEQLSQNGVPFAISFGSGAEGILWGARMSYQRLREDDDYFVSLGGNDFATVYNPSYSKLGLSAGVVFGQAEASVEWVKGNWKLDTSRKSYDGSLDTPDQKTNYLEDGASGQSTVYFAVDSRFNFDQSSAFVSYESQNADLELWDLNAEKNGGSSYSVDDARLQKRVRVGIESVYPVVEDVRLLSKTWLHYETATANEDKNTFFAKDVALRAALATEASVASWAVLRAGVQSSVWGSDQYDRTTYEKVDYSGKSEKVSRSSTFWMREAAQPTLGVGFKFGNYTIDATLAQDGSGDLGFTDKFLGQVEITAQY